MNSHGFPRKLKKSKHAGVFFFNSSATHHTDTTTKMRAVLNNSKLLQQLVESVKELVTDFNIEVSPGGWNIQCMDSSHVALLGVNLRAEGFDEYECDRSHTIGVNIISLSKVLKSANADKSVEVVYKGEGADRLGFKLTTHDSDREIEYQIKLLEIESDILGIPDTEYAVVVSMTSKEFRNIVDELSVHADTVRVDAAKAEVVFSVDGDIGSGKMTVKPRDDTYLTIDEPVGVSLSIKYLKHFVKASAISERVEINITASHPLLVRYDIKNKKMGDAEDEDLGSVCFYLAPKLDQDDAHA
jgi:proliferating cell nuclear antigen